MATAWQVDGADVTTYWYAFNNDNTPKTDITHTTVDLVVGYVRNRSAETIASVGGSPAIVALAADDTVHTDWGVRTIYNNILRVDFPDAMTATGSDFTIPFVRLTNCFFVRASVDDILGSDPRAASLTSAEIIAAEIASLDGLAAAPTTLNINGVAHTITRNAQGWIASITAD